MKTRFTYSTPVLYIYAIFFSIHLFNDDFFLPENICILPLWKEGIGLTDLFHSIWSVQAYKYTIGYKFGLAYNFYRYSMVCKQNRSRLRSRSSDFSILSERSFMSTQQLVLFIDITYIIYIFKDFHFFWL